MYTFSSCLWSAHLFDQLCILIAPAVLVKHGVTVVSTVPTLLSMLESDIPCMRILILGGEACQRDLIDKWAKKVRVG